MKSCCPSRMGQFLPDQDIATPRGGSGPAPQKSSAARVAVPWFLGPKRFFGSEVFPDRGAMYSMRFVGYILALCRPIRIKGSVHSRGSCPLCDEMCWRP